MGPPPGSGAQCYHRDGDTLVVDNGGVLPNVCILTGQPATERVHKKLQWVPPWIAILLVFCSPIVYLLVMLATRRTGEIDFAVSEAAKARRRTGIIAGVGGSFASLAVVLIGLQAPDLTPLLALMGAIGFIVSLVVGITLSNLFTVKKIDGQLLYLRVRPAALAALEALERR